MKWSDVAGSTRQGLRRAWAGRIARGAVECYRCGGPLEAGDAFDLEHDPPWSEGGREVVGVSHASCNRRHGARLRSRRPPLDLGRRPGW